MPLQRIRTDFDFAVLVLLGAVGAVGIAPFAVYRFVHGEWLAGLVDTALVACISAELVYIWRGGSVRVASALVVIAIMAGCAVVPLLLGPAGLFWLFPALLANYFLVGRAWATAAACVPVAFLLAYGGVFTDPAQRVAFLATAAMTCTFSWVFAYRTELQRAQLEALACHDALTGAQNRRAMQRELAIAVEAQRRNQAAVGLAVLDLDHFKQVNDVHGHEAGDRLLVEFADLVRERTRSSDRLFRYGGEEFVLLLPGAGLDALRQRSVDLCAVVAERLQVDGTTVTVSIGAAVLAPGEEAGQWLARADAALYRAKRDGRNRVVVDERAAPAPHRGVLS